jgi:hypothetical protein
MLNIEHAIRGGHAPALAAIDRSNPRALENAATCRFHRQCQSDQVFCRIELGLIGKAQGRRGIERKRRPVQQLRIEADTPGGFRFGRDLIAASGIARIGVSCL